MTHNEKLAHALKLKFGLAPSEPSSAQLKAIKKAIEEIRATGREPSRLDWQKTVAKECPSMGRCKYAGIDNSDLNTLLTLANQSTGK